MGEEAPGGAWETNILSGRPYLSIHIQTPLVGQISNLNAACSHILFLSIDASDGKYDDDGTCIGIGMFIRVVNPLRSQKWMTPEEQVTQHARFEQTSGCVADSIPFHVLFIYPTLPPPLPHFPAPETKPIDMLCACICVPLCLSVFAAG